MFCMWKLPCISMSSVSNVIALCCKTSTKGNQVNEWSTTHWSQEWGMLDMHWQVLCWAHLDSLMQKRRNSIANALELRLFCIKPSISRWVVWSCLGGNVCLVCSVFSQYHSCCWRKLASKVMCCKIPPKAHSNIVCQSLAVVVSDIEGVMCQQNQGGEGKSTALEVQAVYFFLPFLNYYFFWLAAQPHDFICRLLLLIAGAPNRINQGPVIWAPSWYKDCLSRYGDFHYMRIPILVRWLLYNETGPCRLVLLNPALTFMTTLIICTFTTFLLCDAYKLGKNIWEST